MSQRDRLAAAMADAEGDFVGKGSMWLHKADALLARGVRVVDAETLARALRQVSEEEPGLLASADMENEPLRANVQPAAAAILAALDVER